MICQEAGVDSFDEELMLKLLVAEVKVRPRETHFVA